MPFLTLSFIPILFIIGTLFLYQIPYTSGPYLTTSTLQSYSTWFKPISDGIFRQSITGIVILEWVFTNSALLTLLNFALIALSIYYWNKKKMYEQYVEDQNKVSYENHIIIV